MEDEGRRDKYAAFFRMAIFIYEERRVWLRETRGKSTPANSQAQDLPAIIVDGEP